MAPGTFRNLMAALRQRLPSLDALTYHLHMSVLGPLQARRRTGRLLRFGDQPIPVAALKSRGTCAADACAALVSDVERHLTYFKGPQTANAAGAPTASLLPLRDYDSFTAFERAVSQQSGGNSNREVSKARKNGFRSSSIVRSEHARAISEITRSKFFRSGGLVLAALRPAQAVQDTADTADTAGATAPCAEHWNIVWGAFAPATGTTPERLVAYAWLRRCGNIVLTVEMMGHRDFMRDGVVKLLMFDIIRWMLDRNDRRVQGLDYFKYGAIEDAAEGLLEWKRRLMFRPFLLG